MKLHINLLALLYAATLTSAVSAQTNSLHNPHHMPPAISTSDINMQGFPDFPTLEQLKRMVPPEPLTIEKIKQRFTEKREKLKKMIEQDRKRAEQYARDFDRYQKYQALQLAKIMAQAEQQRERMLDRLAEREQQVLKSFKQKDQVPAEAETR